ncbi:MAG: CaiB/BaiF CoA-transferase family protein [Alphaproteobacteria bacterium]|jgi:crotonobetainyl-CoA:carnitine CoA-transferase CaiB-like acyl-CoA transferase|nr:CaiB/BaiF CoA-transferase family protein [Alphaproteobacteria bacterium]MDP6589016.1 CaiB/BaiF CoA-transferase family protein [Alphaproteobacteria bacterium]MDP6817196.1 CaiB/BaiF CoA-transferase family protein [Alphaproteobacteria bacterium]
MSNPFSSAPRSGPLAGLRVLDMSRVLAGPWSGQLMADFGADVVKVERPGVGDDTRGWGPPYLKDSTGEESREAAYYMSTNRAKRSLTLDISKPEGQEICAALAERADVLLENYKLGGLAKFNLDYDSLKERCPRLIYCSITGFGHTGPYAARAGYDMIIQGAGGFMSLTGERDDLPGGGPQKGGVAVSDLMTGMYATVAVLAALAWREKSGAGQHIDLALLDTQVSWLANQAMNYLVSGEVPRRAGNAHQNIVPYGTFPARDGHMILGIGNNTQLSKFLEIAGRAELMDDPRFKDNTVRVQNREAVVAIIGGITAMRDLDDWLAELEPAGVPSGPINTLDRVFDDPQVLARGMRVKIPHALGIEVEHAGNPIRFSASPVDYPRAAPLLGEHSDEVLAEWLGLDAPAIAALRRDGAV